MNSVSPEASTAMPDPRDQRGPTALYRLYAADDTLLYIGVTDDPDRRFKQHRDSKPWWPQVARKTVEWRPSRALALAEEAAAIEAETPVYNIDRNPAAVSYHWPPTGMPADRVDTIEREAATLPADLAEGIRRAAFEGFMRVQLVVAGYAAMLTEYGIREEVWDTSTLDASVRDVYVAHYLEKDGDRLFVVPAGQDPAVNLGALRDLIAHQRVMPV